MANLKFLIFTKISQYFFFFLKFQGSGNTTVFIEQKPQLISKTTMSLQRWSSITITLNTNKITYSLWLPNSETEKKTGRTLRTEVRKAIS